MNENENMKQDLMQFSKAVEMSSRENEVLRQEIQMLKDQLMKKEHDKSHNASSMADKENEIFTLKAEIARTKAMVNASTPISQHSEYKPGSPGLDMLMKQNSHDFATDYLASLKLKTNESAGYNLQNYEDSKINSQSLSTNMQSTYEKFGYKGPMAQPGLSNFSSDSNMSETNFQNTNFSRPQSAMPDQIPDGTSMEPQSISGLQSSTMRGQTSSLNLPNTRFQKQEWNNYLS